MANEMSNSMMAQPGEAVCHPKKGCLLVTAIVDGKQIKRPMTTWEATKHGLGKFAGYCTADRGL